MLQIKELRRIGDFYIMKGHDIVFILKSKKYNIETDNGQSILVEITHFNAKNPHVLRQEIYNNIINPKLSNEVKSNYINVEINSLINKLISFRDFFDPVLKEETSEDLLTHYKSLVFVYYNIIQELKNIVNDAINIAPISVVNGIKIEGILTPDENANYTTAQRFLLLKELGFMDLPDIKGSETYDKNSKNILLSIILSCNKDTAKSYLNNSKKYLPTNQKKNVINDLIQRLKDNSRTKR